MKPRVIPIITISEGRVVKTINFRDPKYVGDVINTVKIFSDLGADEIIILDITATKLQQRYDPDKMPAFAFSLNLEIKVVSQIFSV